MAERAECRVESSRLQAAVCELPLAPVAMSAGVPTLRHLCGGGVWCVLCCRGVCVLCCVVCVVLCCVCCVEVCVVEVCVVCGCCVLCVVCWVVCVGCCVLGVVS